MTELWSKNVFGDDYAFLGPVAVVPRKEGHLGRSGVWGVHVCRDVSRRGPSGAVSPATTQRMGKPSSLSQGYYINC